MLELLVCDVIRSGYKVVIPKNQKVNLLSKYRGSVYTNPNQVKPHDKLKFVSWATATEEERMTWRGYL
jgi:hypothetical protein